MLDVEMHKAEVVVLERALAFGRLCRYWLGPAIEAFGLEDAPDAVAIEMRQEMGDDKVSSSRAKLVTRRSVQTMARSSSVAFHGSRCGRAERSRQSVAPRLRHLRMVSVDTP
jgi:hypothetical protein